MDIHLFHNAESATVAIGTEARTIERMSIVYHRTGNLLTPVARLNPPLLVTDAPQNHGRVVAMVNDHPFQQVEMLLVGTHQTVLIDTDHTQRIANIEHHVGGWIMRPSDSIHAQLTEFIDTVYP